MDRRFYSEIEQSAKEFSWKETLENEIKLDGYPKFLLNLDLVTHVKASDLSPETKVRMRDADIIVVESVRWDSDTYEFLNDISQGKINPDDWARDVDEEDVKNSFKYEYYKNLYNSKKPVLVIDLPESKVSEMDKVVDNFQKLRKEVWEKEGDNFESILKIIRLTLEKDEKLSEARNEFAVKFLPILMKKFLDNHEKLKEKEKLNIQITFGSLHSPLVKMLKNNFETKTFLHEKVIPQSIKMRHRIANKLEVSDEEIARYWLHQVVSDYVYENYENPEELDLKMEKEVFGLSISEIKLLYALIEEDEAKFYDKLDLVIEKVDSK